MARSDIHQAGDQPGRSPMPGKGRLSLYATIGVALIVIALLVIFVF